MKRGLTPFLLLIGLILLNPIHTRAQANSDFNVTLNVDVSSAESVIQLFDDQPLSTDQVAAQRGNVIAAATAGYIADRGSAAHSLRSYLDSLRYHQRISDDVYHLEEGREHLAAIKELLRELKIRNFSRRVSATVEQIFPQDAKIQASIPMYVVALGHENVDAFVRRIKWHGDIPEFVGEGEGELTIVVNLTHAVQFGSSLDERFVSLLGVVAHEVFHAAFGLYQQGSPTWKAFQSERKSPMDELMELCQNEGIAYFLSFEQQWHDRIPRDWSERARNAFQALNENSKELISGKPNGRRVMQILREANMSGSHDNYGAMAGMMMAREIDAHLGRRSLIETISAGPVDFFRKYSSLSSHGGDLPSLAPELDKYLNTP